jgi:hypothetical protein
VLGVGAHLGERPLDAAHELVVDLVVHDVREPPGGLLLDLVADQRVVLLHQAGDEAEGAVEQLLVAVARR